ncbi:cupin domain-containing protein [Adhaeribacter aquaticus]|uniref:cupin domain-containing protein n=1 Tax=Adhaeribacter aquaticus TaxID=299567 RepID=UPI000401BA83|nr:cupin domain-containing protein [Adhaeribacter aquaticus]
MRNIAEFIESGILELYVMGSTTPEETQEVELLAAQHPEIQAEINAISTTMEAYAMAHAVEPNPTIKYLVMATIDYMERLKNGELSATPPELTPASKVADYAEWLNRSDLQAPAEVKEIYVKLIGATPEATTAIVWLKEGAPTELHHDEHERFLILEGTCAITSGDQIYHLGPGDFYAVPLHVPHSFQVTSEIPCKVILQRVAA